MENDGKDEWYQWYLWLNHEKYGFHGILSDKDVYIYIYIYIYIYMHKYIYI